MGIFAFLATPIWVNLLLLVPLATWIYFRKNKLSINRDILLKTGVFGIAFGFIEAACIIYLRAATGLLPGFQGTLSDVQKQSIGIYNQLLLQQRLPISLLTVEIIREIGTMVMIISIAFVTTKYLKERIAMFLWVFAFWDIFYYVFLYLTVRWPEGLRTQDVLFLIPQPWFGEVWMPILISSTVIISIFLNTKKNN